MAIEYPAVERVIEFNVLVLTMIKAKKSDAPHVLSRQKIAHAIEECKMAEGDICRKAAVLMRALVAAHAFASGNRRTAFVAAKAFVIENGGKFAIKDDPAHAKVMQGMREGYYKDEEIAEWMRNGKIREFRR